MGMEMQSKRKTLDNTNSVHTVEDAIPFIQALQTVAKALFSEKKTQPNKLDMVCFGNQWNGMEAGRFSPASH